MTVVFIVLPIALLIAAVAVGAFVWAARSGQFDDLDTPSMRVLLDDESRPDAPRATDDDWHDPIVKSIE